MLRLQHLSKTQRSIFRISRSLNPLLSRNIKHRNPLLSTSTQHQWIILILEILANLKQLCNQTISARSLLKWVMMMITRRRSLNSWRRLSRENKRSWWTCTSFNQMRWRLKSAVALKAPKPSSNGKPPENNRLIRTSRIIRCLRRTKPESLPRWRKIKTTGK